MNTQSHFCSVEFDADEGLNTFQEDIYEHEIRLPFTSFGHYEVYWADVVSLCLFVTIKMIMCYKYACSSVVTSLLGVMTNHLLVIKCNAQMDGSGLPNGK